MKRGEQMTKIYIGETNTNSANGIEIIKTHLSVREVHAAIIKAEKDETENNTTEETSI